MKFLPPSIMHLRLNRDTTSAAERLALWKELMGAGGDVHIADPDSFTGEFVSRSLGELRTMRIRAGSFGYIRNRDMARRIRRDHVMINLTEQGCLVGEIAARKIVAGPGAVVISRLATPMNLMLEDAEWLALIVPRGVLDRCMSWSPKLDARVFAPQTAQAIILAGLLRSLDTLAQPLSVGETACAVRSSLALLAACLGGPPPAPQLRAPAKNDRARSIRRFIAERLPDPDLGLDLICGEFEISRSQLYRIMGESADLAAIIRRLRLQAIRREILSAPLSQRPLADIAKHWGLVDERNFRRAFSKEFGYPPSALRKQPQGDPHSAVTDMGTIGADLERWFLGLGNES